MSIVLVPLQPGHLPHPTNLPTDEPNERTAAAAKAAVKIDYYASGKREEDEEAKRAVYGLCGKCANFSYRVTVQDGNEDVYAECEAWRLPPFGAALRLGTSKKIKDCSLFRIKNAIPLSLMFEMATLLGPDVEESKKKAEEKKKLREAPEAGYL